MGAAWALHAMCESALRGSCANSLFVRQAHTGNNKEKDNRFPALWRRGILFQIFSTTGRSRVCPNLYKPDIRKDPRKISDKVQITSYFNQLMHKYISQLSLCIIFTVTCFDISVSTSLRLTQKWGKEWPLYKEIVLWYIYLCISWLQLEQQKDAWNMH